jgi:Predicted acetyltransferase
MAEVFFEKETINLLVKGKEVGYITFIVIEGVMEIKHTVVYPEFRRKGYGKTLVDSAISTAESRNLTVTSTCSYADKILGEK